MSLPVEVVRHYQEVVWHLLDEIQALQMERIKLMTELEHAKKQAQSSSVGKDVGP